MKKYLIFGVFLAVVQLFFLGSDVASGEILSRHEEEISSLEDENQQLSVLIARDSSYTIITQKATELGFVASARVALKN